MLGGTEWHLTRQHGSRHRRAHRELKVRKWRRSFQPNTVAFFSSKVEKADKDCKCCWAEGGRGEVGGLMDVETGGVT